MQKQKAIADAENRNVKPFIKSLITCCNWNDYDAETKAGFICEFEDYYTIGDATHLQMYLAEYDIMLGKQS